MHLRVLAVAGLLLAACGATAPAGPTWHKEIAPLVQARCGGCHAADGIAPFPLQTYAQASEKRALIRDAVASGRMPPWPPGKGCTDYAGDRSLRDAEKALLLAWLGAGAPEGDPAAAADRFPAERERGLSRVDLELKMAEPYQPVQSPDEYRCFVLDWPATATKYVTGFAARPGNGTIVHHVIAFLASPAQVARYQQLDAAEAGPGYTCFGGPGGTDFSMLGGWAPGTLGSDFPAGTGFKVLPGSKVVLQVHYNTGHHGAAGQADQTSIQLKLDDAVARQAVALPWADPSWITKQTMSIPAGAADTEHSFAFDPSPYLGYLTGNVVHAGAPYWVYSANLHMHVRGSRGRLEILRRNGDAECMLDVPQWDFHWQGSYGFAQPKQVLQGDKLKITCHWDNSAANQPEVDGVTPPPKDLNWGEGTGDEMCIGFLYITE